MADCHTTDAPVLPDAPPRRRRVALAGNPNVGKTTTFNLLTGLRQKVGNYPGVTVEKKTGRFVGDEHVEVVDLPGTYSLNPTALAERVATAGRAGRLAGAPPPDLVVCVADATNLERNLYLVTQVVDLGLPVVVALNMIDEAEEQGLDIDAAKLERELGVPVLPMSAARGDGVGALRRIVAAEPPPVAGRRWELMPAVAPVVARLEDALASVTDVPPALRFSEALRALTSDVALERWARRAPGFHAAVLAERAGLEERKVPYQQAEVAGRYGFLAPLAARVVTRRPKDGERTRSDKIDAVVTHRVFGPLIFVGVLVLIFQAVFTWAIPAMDAIQWAVDQVGVGVAAVMPDGALESLLVDGVVAGVGNVLVFLPQILLLFFFLGLMEDTGYMARTAFIMDRLMRQVGLSGGSVVPLLSSFACAIPGIMAARTLDNHRDRVVTIMVAPLMSCSARLPVYTLFIAAFIPAGSLFGFIGYQGLAMFSMYALGVVMAFTAAFILKRYVIKGPPSFFVMELPPYRRPRMKQVLWRMQERSKMFVVRAGKMIFGLSIVLWFLASYPKSSDPALEAQLAAAQAAEARVADSLAMAHGLSAEAFAHPEALPAEAASALAPAEARVGALQNAAAGYQIRHSFIGMLGRGLEPVMRPLGFDWKLSAGIVSAFAAREVIIATLATIYSVGDGGDDAVDLQQALKADRDPETGAPVYTTLVALSLLVFFVLALQCMSTLAIARRELNSWVWPAVMWGYMFVLAYAFSFVVYQGGQLLGLG